MKKITVIFSLMIIYFITISIEKLKADEPCVPDCENSAWSSSQQISIYLSSCGGNITVTYKFRVACNIFYDYYIERVSFSSAIRDCLDRVYGGDLNQILQHITEALIIANPANFPPTEPNKCETNWRVMKGSCWMPTIIPHVPMVENGNKIKSDDLHSYVGYDVLIPCTYDDCCLEYFTVCTDLNNNRTITQTGYLPPEDPECEGNYNELCVPVYGSIYNR